MKKKKTIAAIILLQVVLVCQYFLLCYSGHENFIWTKLSATHVRFEPHLSFSFFHEMLIKTLILKCIFMQNLCENAKIILYWILLVLSGASDKKGCILLCKVCVLFYIDSGDTKYMHAVQSSMCIYSVMERLVGER